MSKKSSIIPIEHIERTIYTIRGYKVMLDRDLAELYGVEVKALNQAVKRNSERFPEDFMFQLNKDELSFLGSQFVTIENLRCQNGTLDPLRSQIVTLENLKSQIVTSKGHGGVRKLPYAFTEQGLAILSGVLRSPRAVAVNIEIMRTFVRFRHILSSQKELEKIVTELRSFVLKKSAKTDQEVQKIWQAIEKLSPSDDGRKIGFELD